MDLDIAQCEQRHGLQWMSTVANANDPEQQRWAMGAEEEIYTQIDEGHHAEMDRDSVTYRLDYGSTDATENLFGYDGDRCANMEH